MKKRERRVPGASGESSEGGRQLQLLTLEEKDNQPHTDCTGYTYNNVYLHVVMIVNCNINICINAQSKNDRLISYILQLPVTSYCFSKDIRACKE